MMLQIDDAKVFGANIVCMLILKIQNVNTELQTVLFIMTIVYTIFRIANEIKKLVKNGKAANEQNGD
jgi:hypothetical protein